MSDILKYITQNMDAASDPYGWKIDTPEWSEEAAINIATEEDIFMTADHWQVIEEIRKHYFRNGPTTHARTLTLFLDSTFKTQGGKRFLYSLFPNGPVHQSCKIAGIPIPNDSINPSFGVVQ